MTRLLLFDPPLDLVVRDITANLHELLPRHDPLVSLLGVNGFRRVLYDGLQVRESISNLLETHTHTHTHTQ